MSGAQSPFDSGLEGEDVLFSTSAADTRASRREALPGGHNGLLVIECC